MTQQDRERFDGFIRASRAPMLRIAHNLCRNTGREPKDVVHEALVRVLKHLERGGGPDPLTLSFVSKVMTHHHSDLFRRKRAQESSLASSGPEPEEESVMPDPEPA